MRQINQGLIGALIICGSSFAYAQVEEAGNINGERNIQLAQASGGQVAEYSAVLTELSGLEVYNELRQRQIANQVQELEELRAGIELVPDLERQVPPLLIRMIDGLEEFVELDIPFLADERANRLAELQLIVERTDVNDAEKFRRDLEAWQVENEYGRSVSAYVDELEIDGVMRQVDFLRVGRIALIYQTTDEAAESGAWDPTRNAFVPLGSQHRNSIRQALRMARNQVAPEIVLLPTLPAAQ